MAGGEETERSGLPFTAQLRRQSKHLELWPTTIRTGRRTYM
jgi:hypothetical protein